MPGLFHQPIDRRRFLRTTVLGGACLVFNGCRAVSDPAGAGREFHLALLSDTHIPADPKNGYRGFSPGENLRRVVSEVLAAGPEAMVLNGDAARLEGKIEDYREAKGLLEPLAARMPVTIGLGNHDHRDNFLKVFPEPAEARSLVDQRHVLVIEHDVLRLIVLDSLLYTNQTAGLLGRAQRTWLAAYLPRVTDRPVVLVVHHTLNDGDGDLLDADRLFALLQPHRHVKAIFYGHSHVWALSERQKVQMINLPAVGYNFDDKDPVGWVDARFRTGGVSLTLHAIGGNRAEDGRQVALGWA